MFYPFNSHNSVIVVFILLIFFSTSCQNDKNKVAQLESEIASLKAENNSLRYNSTSASASASIGALNQSDSRLSGYYMYSDNRLMEAFKDYMSDEFFSYDSFKKTGKTLRIKVPVISNITIRSIQKHNPEIFTELLNRLDKIVFFDDFGASMTVKKLDE